jgi:hypothetical protein
MDFQKVAHQPSRCRVLIALLRLPSEFLGPNLFKAGWIGFITILTIAPDRE